MKTFPLQVSFFGAFTLCDAEGHVLLRQTRGNKSYTLLQYLLYNSDRGMRRADLMEFLIGDAQLKDAANTMKIIIHRTRRLLEDAGLPASSIRYQQGVYRWNEAIPCESDCGRFRRLLRESEDCADRVKAEAALREAIRLHQEPFLAHAARSRWVEETAAIYRNAYCLAIKRIAALLGGRGAYGELLPLLEQALALYPGEETMHYLYIACLHDMGRGAEIPHASQRAQRQISGGGAALKELQQRLGQRWESGGLAAIKRMLDEAPQASSSYCPPELFAGGYHQLLRAAERCGQRLTLLLITITDENGMRLRSECAIAGSADSLYEAIAAALRGSDLYTRIATDRFLVLLTNADETAFASVCNRLDAEYAERSPRYYGARLAYETCTADPAQAIAEGAVY